MNSPPPDETAGPVSGFWALLAHVLTTLLDMISTRMELLFVDLQESSERLLGLLIWSLAGLLATAMTLFLGSLCLIFIFWDTHRVLVALLMTASFAALAITAALVVVAKVRARHTMFAATLTEFSKDRERFKVVP
jgi:uncharacterized membrane protein YqjE